MKRLLPFFLLSFTSLCAEEVIVKQSTIMRGERSIVSIKAGTEVELVSIDGEKATITYNDITGTIPASKLEEPPSPAPAKSSASVSSAPSSGSSQPAQSNYGRAVEKARQNASAHDKNTAATNEVLGN